jgi:hypothetical protein
MVDKVPLLRDIDAFVHQRQALFLGVAISITAAGALAFLGGIVSMVISSGRPMSKEEIERLHAQLMAAQQAGIARGARYRLMGEQVGAEAVDEFSMAAMKYAWNAGLWWSVPLWRRRFLMTGGACALLGGVAGLVIVLSSLGYKLLTVACVVYVFVRTALAFRRAG